MNIVERTQRTTTRAGSVHQQIELLVRMRTKGRFRGDEHRSVLRVFFTLYRDARERAEKFRLMLGIELLNFVEYPKIQSASLLRQGRKQEKILMMMSKL